MSDKPSIFTDRQLKILEFENRKSIMDIEGQIGEMEGARVGHVYDYEHSFAKGMYIRQITVPAGTMLTTMILKHQHPTFLLSGTVRVVNALTGELEDLTAPQSFITESGTKRAILCVTEVVWTTIHLNPTESRDIDWLVADNTSESYKEYDKFKAKELPWYKRAINILTP